MVKPFEIKCDICKEKFDDLDVFEEHWKKKHAHKYGVHSYKEITWQKGVSWG